VDTFADLPDALVRDILAKAAPVAEGVANTLREVQRQRSRMRDEAARNGLIRRKADLDVSREPSVVGIDGSYQIHRLTAVDLCAAAAVAVEGTAKEAKRHWPEPYHEMWVECIPHSADTTGVLRGIMVSMELKLAEQAPHDLVLLDGSFASLIIYLNQAITKLAECAPEGRKEFLTRWESGIFQQLKRILRSDRAAALPKFTSRNELVQEGRVNCHACIDGKTLATLVLEPGEYTAPLPVLGANETYHIPQHTYLDGNKIDFCSAGDIEDMNAALGSVSVIYYRPYGWIPALRIELPAPVSASNTRLSLVLEGITRQFFSPAVVEPYPLFLADRMVKSLGSGVAVIEQAVSQHVAESTPDVETTMLCLQNYRTEGGRGGV
jgi:hypothetical protein